MLARAGYQPREMANMFKTIEAEGGGQGPQWNEQPPESEEPLRSDQS
jgi:predicted Zn-dependent protease